MCVYRALVERVSLCVLCSCFEESLCMHIMFLLSEFPVCSSRESSLYV